MSSPDQPPKIQEQKEISQIAKICRGTISDLVEAVQANDASVTFQVSEKSIQQMQERYDQWTGNLGAVKPSSSRASLEYRLRDSLVVKDAIVRMLEDLNESAQAATDILTGKRRNRTTETLIVSDIDLTEYEISSSDSDSDADSESSTSTSESSAGAVMEIQELISAIKKGLDNLFKASIFIRKFGPKNRRQRASDIWVDNRADVMYIKDRYPVMIEKNESLLTRLGEANARRRRYFIYCERHNQKLSRSDVEESKPSLPVNPGPITNKSNELVVQEAGKSVLSSYTKPSLLAETEATAFISPHDQNQGPTFLEVEPAMSVVSFATSIVESPDANLAFPPLPDEAENNRHIMCPYCCTMIDLKSRDKEKHWRKHIIDDLEPYICTFPACGLDSYKSQRAWFEHELLMHRVHWPCPKCQQIFSTGDSLKHHISQRHSEDIPPNQVTAMVEQVKRPISSISPSQCPFCDEKWATVDPHEDAHEEPGDQFVVVELDQFRKHLGHHLQQVALFSLPRFNQTEGAESQFVDGHLDRDSMSEGYKWMRDDCGRGWTIIAGKRATFIAICFFLKRCREKDEFREMSVEYRNWWRSGSEEVDPNAKIGILKQTALHEAAGQGDIKMIQKLLQMGANINNYDADGDTPLHWALENKKEEAAMALIEAGADAHAKNRNGQTPLHITATHGDTKMIQKLLQMGANIDELDASDNTPLHLALKYEREQAAMALIEAGADVNVKNNYGDAPLHVAAMNNSGEMVRMLLTKGANDNTPLGSSRWDRKGWPPLQCAVQRGDVEIVKILAEHDKTTKEKAVLLADKGGNTALHILSKYGKYGDGTSVAILHELLSITPEIDINAQNQKGQTPLDIARERKKQELIAALLEAGAK